MDARWHHLHTAYVGALEKNVKDQQMGSRFPDLLDIGADAEEAYEALRSYSQTAGLCDLCGDRAHSKSYFCESPRAIHSPEGSRKDAEIDAARARDDYQAQAVRF